MHAPASQVECIIWMPHACFVATFTVMTVYVCLHETRLIAVVLANTAVTLQWNLRERDTLGKWPMSLVERLSLSRRFVFFFIVSPKYMFVSNI